MGRQVLPSISKIEEVLDLVTNPDKYIQYMKEFRDVYNETMNVLGILDTKEKADRHYADAVDILAVANMDKQSAARELENIRLMKAELLSKTQQADEVLRSAEDRLEASNAQFVKLDIAVRAHEAEKARHAREHEVELTNLESTKQAAMEAVRVLVERRDKLAQALGDI